MSLGHKKENLELNAIDNVVYINEKKDKTQTNCNIGYLRDKTNRITSLLDKYPDEFIEACKIWIAKKNDTDILCLRVLAQLLSDVKMNDVLKELDPSEKEAWRIHLKESLSGHLYLDSLESVEKELKKQILSPCFQMNPELSSLLSKLTHYDLQKIYRDNVEHLPLLLNYIDNETLSPFLNELDSSSLETLINDSFELSDQEEGHSHKVINFLKDYYNTSKRSSFSKNIMSSISKVIPKKEKMLYQILHQNKMENEVFEAAKAALPFDAAFMLSPLILTKILKSYDENKIVDFLLVVDEEHLPSLLSYIGEEGSKSRDVIDMELSEVSEAKKRALELRKDSILFEFIQYTRIYLETSNETVDDVVNMWVEKILFGSKK